MSKEKEKEKNMDITDWMAQLPQDLQQRLNGAGLEVDMQGEHLSLYDPFTQWSKTVPPNLAAFTQAVQEALGMTDREQYQTFQKRLQEINETYGDSTLSPEASTRLQEEEAFLLTQVRTYQQAHPNE